MISKEEAQAHMKAAEVAEGKRVETISKLPAKLKKATFDVFDIREEGKENEWNRRYERQLDGIKVLEESTPEERMQVYQAALPMLAPYLEAGWQLIPRLPYQIGGERRAFRASKSQVPYRNHRIQFLNDLWNRARPYQAQEIEWFAAYAAYLSQWNVLSWGVLFAGVMEMGGAKGDAVFDILMASARGDHPIGAFGNHVIRALSIANRPEGWEYLEKMLLAAQREEGLRQSILEQADMGHPEFFRRMLHLVLDNDLIRFSATIRAADVWFGFLHEATSPAKVRNLLTQMLTLVEDPAAREAALQSEDLNALYLALCAVGFEDAYVALERARTLTTAPNPEVRLVAYHFLRQLKLEETQPIFRQGLQDEDLRVTVIALGGVYRQGEQDEELFNALEILFTRYPEKPKTYPAVIWDWFMPTVDRDTVTSSLYNARGTLPPQRLIPYLDVMGGYFKANILRSLAAQTPWTAEIRQLLIASLSDRTETVRHAALEAMKVARPTAEEAQTIEGLLTRKSNDLRRGVIQLLLNQEDADVAASAERLLAHKQEPVRLAGLEVVRQLQQAERATAQIPTLLTDYQENRPTLSTAETTLLESMSATDTKAATLDDALGLCDHSQRTPPLVPQTKRKWLGMAEDKPPLQSDTATKFLSALSALVEEHATDPVVREDAYGQREFLLGNMNYAFPSPNWNKPLAEDIERLPLRELWETWWQSRPASQRNPDGLDMVRIFATFNRSTVYYREIDMVSWQADLYEQLFVTLPKIKYNPIVQRLTEWFLRMSFPDNAVALILDGVEYTLARIPAKIYDNLIVTLEKNGGTYDERGHLQILGWLQTAYFWQRMFPQQWEPAQVQRLWGLARYLDEPRPNQLRMRPPFDLLKYAYALKFATDADMYDFLLGTRSEVSRHTSFYELRNLTTHKKLQELAESDPSLYKIVTTIRARIIEVELQRGDLPTAATPAAQEIASVEGMATVIALLKSLGNASLTRHWRDYGSKAGTFSQLLRVSLPAPDDTPAAFAKTVKAEKVTQARLIELSLAAPQWSSHVEAALKWAGFAEAVWWILAHTKDNRWGVSKEIKELWTAQVSERTPLTAAELLEGAVDVAWFYQVYETVGAEHWKKLYDAAKYASGGQGHTRAKLFADAMLDKVTTDELSTRALSKRHQDSLRALGLIPLPKGKAQAAEVEARYRTIQEFRHGSRQFGSQRQASEKLAAEIAMANLARTAGYADPMRLQWAMEAVSAADLRDGALTATVDAVTVSLAVNEFGEGELTITKNGKPLKKIPPAVKKVPEVAALVTRQSEIKKQISRMRQSLEEAMVRGDAFTGKEMAELGEHPLLAALLEDLVFMGEGVIGYPTDNGRGLRDTEGKVYPLGANEQVRIAHPYDLYQRGDWQVWQHDCFLAERSQPFKQVFRELYVLTEAEKGEGHASLRYAGHQVQPKQALALFGGRGWVSQPYEGVSKTFHAEKITVRITALGFTGSPADIEGITLEGVVFCEKGTYTLIPLTEIPARLFSEVMRDLDLVVSVAHMGGIDPEASASTVDMRAALIRETTALLGISNVSLTSSHALVKGDLNQYSVHLGSATVHRQPGGALCIIPVHSQHRGRIFLPFADSDPKSAEVLSKVLLLARDKEIKDPTILQQLL